MIAVVAGWDALVHRAVRRYVAGPIVVAALVEVVLLLDLHALTRIVVVVALVLGSLAAARVALHDLLVGAPGCPRRSAPQPIEGGRIWSAATQPPGRSRSVAPARPGAPALLQDPPDHRGDGQQS